MGDTLALKSHHYQGCSASKLYFDSTGFYITIQYKLSQKNGTYFFFCFCFSLEDCENKVLCWTRLQSRIQKASKSSAISDFALSSIKKQTKMQYYTEFVSRPH